MYIKLLIPISSLTDFVFLGEYIMKVANMLSLSESLVYVMHISFVLSHLMPNFQEEEEKRIPEV